MSEKYYKIKYGSMDQLYSLVGTRINGWYTELNTWYTACEKLMNLEQFQGESATAVKAYLQEVHGVLICSIQQTLAEYQSKYLLYKTGYYNLEGNLYASLPQETMINICKRLNTEQEILTGISNSIGGCLNSISDILALGNPTKYVLENTMEGIHKEISEFDKGIEAYEDEQQPIATGTLKDLILTLQKTVEEYLASEHPITEYQSGTFAGSTSILDLYDKVQRSSEYIEKNKEAIELAAVEQEEAYAQMMADYEAACEARKDKGTANMIMGGVAVVVGVVAIVGTAGMATSIVITAGVTGSCTIAYGLSNTVEGAQDLYYGSIGDLSTDAINPIRDTIFMGNQSLYDMWGSLNMTVAGLCVPTGQAVNGVAGAGKDIMAKTVMKTVAKEVAKDQVCDFAS